MLLLVISDSHGSIDKLNKLFKKEKDYNVLVHLGDGLDDLHAVNGRKNVRIFTVRGNEDIGSPDPVKREERIYHLKLFLVHGDGMNVKRNLDNLIVYGIEGGFDIILFGHTHQPFAEMIDGRLFFNPGALLDGYYGLIEITKEQLNWEIKTI